MDILIFAAMGLSLALGAPFRASILEPGFARTAASKPVSWRGSTGDLFVNVRFEQARDSIYGRGTYKVGPRKRVGCGGETLSRSGSFAIRAEGNLAAFQGKLLFDSGWTPPFSARQTTRGAIRVSIASVDRGACIMTLRN